jgi:hypothetical protein
MANEHFRIPVPGSRIPLLVALVAGSVMIGAQKPPVDPFRSVAERYVKLVLAVGQHDADYVDAFYGPAEWRKQAEAAKVPLATIDTQAAALETELAKITVTPPKPDVELWTLRRQYLSRQLASMRARLGMLQGKKLSFDEESLALYDAVSPVKPVSEFDAVLKQLEARLPGDGSLIARYDAYKQGFVIPKARVDRVFQEAIRGCKQRSLGMDRVDLPLEENFRVEYVTGKSWSGYNWYQGNFKSLIQVNTDLPIYIDRAIDLACHEGYPGHHVYNALLEKHLVKDRGWVEFTVYPLFSPQSLIAEGTANYGIEVAFTPQARLAFEHDILFPLAGIDPATVTEYYEILELVERLSYAGNEAARKYINGEIDREGAITWLEQYAMYTRPRAEQRVKFIDQYRSYVINYNLGKDMVRAYVEKKMGRDKTPARRWKEFTALLSSPRLPSGLK